MQHDDFNSRAIPAFPRQQTGVRLVSLTSGEEIKPGDTIPEPHGHGEVTYVGPTVRHDEGDDTPRPGRVAVVRYKVPATGWSYLPTELGARYEDADAAPRHGDHGDGTLPPQNRPSE
ncbi:hypothetical protein [Streptomyces candidus]|uniref:Uncharacterized protein n=1 Tax=Streptomyces candidus TaxID=67283 RepID=A0A7X0LTG3_9ACTN|nr:hypothetical protein [Streptomyces candidus]MBB6440247.1 hypothetical protein [Streptomyces candidus]GHH57759.1 hypothetical protein GCM10018773_65590 [Streptomyces candidus]